MLAVAVPLGLAIAMNALVRPALAERLGGERMRSTTTAKSSDGRWVFDAATRAEHPALTAFLEFSDGALAMSLLGVAVIAAVAVLAADRLGASARTP